MSEILQWIGEQLATNLTVANVTSLLTGGGLLAAVIAWIRAKSRLLKAQAEAARQGSESKALKADRDQLAALLAAKEEERRAAEEASGEAQAALLGLVELIVVNSKMTADAKALAVAECEKVRARLQEAAPEAAQLLDRAKTLYDDAKEMAEPVAEQLTESARTILDQLREDAKDVAEE